MKYELLTENTAERFIDREFCQYDSISVSPENYDPNIPLEIYGDHIVQSLTSPISAVLPDDFLSESTILEY
jgi:hypothetical protein